MKHLVLATLLAVSGTAFAASHGAMNHAAHGTSHGSPADASSLPVSASVKVEDCWVRSLPAPAPSGGYFVLKNESDQDVVVKGASSPAYGMVMLHETSHAGGMSRMAMVEQITVPAKGTLEFKPGGYHAMLEDAVSPPSVGSKIPLDLILANGEKASAQCEIRSATGAPSHAH